MAHPLDRPVSSSFCGRQSGFALAEGAARRLAPDYGLFAAVADTSAESLADLAVLVGAHGDVALVEPCEPPGIAGLIVTSRAQCWQMIAQC